MPEDKGWTRSQREEKILQFWKENKIFEKSLSRPARTTESGGGDFVFYEGPPTANAKPAFHHIIARVFKDAIPRYKTMQGFRVPRQAGWDTHGLPVELQIEKKLGFTSKKDIEEYGVEKFNRECKESVFEYIGDWRKFTERIGYWTDFDRAYYTFNNSYMESVWKIIAHVEDRKLLYKDYKVLPWCPRCGTALSSHELAQGYADVKDLSLYVKFKVSSEQENSKSSGRSAQPDIPIFLLAWTTTPWTLPGNLALTVGKDIDYVKVKQGDEYYILAEARLGVLKDEYEVVEKMKGSDLVGLEYEPLYNFIENNGKAFKVYSADFVTTEDGTGIVHTAVMYGQDDFELGTKEGLPKVHLVNPDATFKPDLGWLSGRSVVDPELAVDVLKDLKDRGLLFDKEQHTHSYPFCWRCKTRLIYYARDSWYIEMSKLRDELVKENEKINWEPDYIKQGRFGEWLREVKDWAISRERYWGTPLPVWLSASGERLVIGSIESLKKYTKKSGNKYFVMRHGGTEGNLHEVVSYRDQADDHLTEAGREGVRKVAQGLDTQFDLIVSSPFARTKETAEIVKEVTRFSGEITFDERIREVNPGDYDGKSWLAYHEAMEAREKDWFKEAVAGGESLREVLKRVGECLSELEAKYQGKKILIITHGGPAWLMNVAAGLYLPEGKPYQKPTLESHTPIFVPDFRRFANAEVRELDFVTLPHNEYYELDLHKPFIDEVVLERGGQEYRRVKEVMDVWLDSGSMPFASTDLYPADFISEAIDQTRGWFYTLHAVGVLMGKGLAYKNVICLGHILDKDGKKMSKSLGNIIDPDLMIEKYGVDVLRLWMYSVNQPGESKNFDERSVEELQKRVFNLLDNVYSFYALYADLTPSARPAVAPLLTLGEGEGGEVLDRWILARLNELVNLMTLKLDSYKLLEPVRDLRDFVDDLSTWYVRRSRDRIKNGDTDAKQTLHFVLLEITKLLAPFAPFAAEELYQKLRRDSDPESVHLCEWPKGRTLSIDSQGSTLGDMQEVRRLVSLALEARQKANLKIRQPLALLKVKTELTQEFLEIIKEELNVKEVVLDISIDGGVWLDTALTPALVEEGEVRDIIRSIQDLRKEKNLLPSDVLEFDVPSEKKELYEKYAELIRKATNTKF